MILTEIGIKALSRHLPKRLSPKTHAIIDYGIAGAFFLGAGLLWGKSKRAAMASLACGAAETAVILLTDYPGGAAKLINFERHGQIDAAMSGTVVTLPGLLGFKEETPAILFRLQGIGIGIIASMTDFKALPSSVRRRAA
jgi:hypothetical protein